MHIAIYAQDTDHSDRLTDSAIGKRGSAAKRADEEAPPGSPRIRNHLNW